MNINKPDYKGFCEHVEEWNRLGIPWGISDLMRIAKRYNTPVPKFVRRREVES